MTDKKTVLVTGANRGIGRAMADEFSRNGYHVIAGVRSEDAGKSVLDALAKASGSAEYSVIDLGDNASINSAVEGIKNSHKKIDAIVNNAAVHVGMTDTIFEASSEDFALSAKTNAFGPLELTKAVLPLLEAADGARVVNVSSSVGSVSETSDPNSAYGFYDTASYRLSKTMLNGITGMMAKTLRDSGIKVNAMCPGWTQTDMGGPDAPNTPAQGARLAYRLATLPADGPTGAFFNEAGPIDW